jgi:hypothetical protein
LSADRESVDRVSAEGVARLSTGGPSESRGTDRGEDDEEDEAAEEESPGVISAFGVPSPELETGRRMRGGAPSLPLDELLEELFDELFDELATVSSELELARRSLGRSGSLSSEELDELEPDEIELDEFRDEPPELSSELDAARRNVGLELEPVEELPAELFEELPLEEDEPSDLGNGLVSSVCSDASECSSAVPSRTIDIVTAL